MAISPWHLLSVLRCEDAASLLAGFDPAVHVVDSYRGHRYDEWRRVMVEEAQAGLLRPVRVFVGDDEEQAYTDSYNPQKLVQSWQEISPDKDGWRQLTFEDIRLSFERAELYRWLRTKIKDDKIPEALRASPKLEGLDKPLHHKRRKTYLTLIEGLAMEAMKSDIPDEPYAAAKEIQRILELNGLKLDKDPVAETVREIYDARIRRDEDDA